uniref:TPM domain-containing protein n=1 Tax=Chromera velia CCMP2878 TaxID=1169474 RepID=A0A0G4G387_9ALVE|mmetsp:Transcript_28328/g.55463  ORF Transcript_28328/g.55463 Transcript_28328/m.55463 type:complete len:279 (+) Transcript_28328:259-1095(+)|eukprot:Cvel_20064.t1-p1 / transcript=Cvel_20064.t1 / gene=Cvel_20064 / organism=Chromera_velia_CCMP2878 / gene_product=Thylakoid lumenal 15.0 kDa protein 2, chloroplastic, putative / transcript_product=Thylakoid lumenal 15.0 kDa protein 2, chloroplastic, putative / location=Cvel_scaffold1774:28646-31776(+) / protein_length=278 / sequence_SO=supercontig / SO=protein_coding / is_pseudo=false
MRPHPAVILFLVAALSVSSTAGRRSSLFFIGLVLPDEDRRRASRLAPLSAREEASEGTGAEETGDIATRRGIFRRLALGSVAVSSGVAFSSAVGTKEGMPGPFSLLTPTPEEAQARPQPVNRPDLLPKGPKRKVIDIVGYLTSGEEKRLEELIDDIENETGYKLRILCQDYPETPGGAIKDYWGVDKKTIVLVCDKSFGGNLLNFNVGEDDDLRVKVTNQFWTRLANKYGNKYNVEKLDGEDRTILKTAYALQYCLKNGCADIPPDNVLPDFSSSKKK